MNMDLNSLKALKFKGFKMLKGILVRFKYSEMWSTQIFLTNKYKSIPNSRQRTHKGYLSNMAFKLYPNLILLYYVCIQTNQS